MATWALIVSGLPPRLAHDGEARGKNSNKEMDATFVYNDNRVLYNVGTLYSGSPWHTPSYVGPVGSTVCDTSCTRGLTIHS